MLFVAANLDEAPVLDLVDHCAGVWTIVRTGAEEFLPLRLLVHISSV
jgi:hypothetical protein